ncbi:MAG: phosphoglycerate kinase, partial [Acidimicrobiia bacterium]
MASADLPTIDSLRLSGRTVLVRSDLNVPLENGVVTDTFRIAASLGTIDELVGRAGRVVVASHLGRPQGHDPSLSMRPVAEALSRMGGFETVLAPGVIGP